MQRSFGQEISGNRGRGKELSSESLIAIISQHEAGVSRQELAAEFGCSPSCIYRTIKRWKQHKTFKSLPQSGRPEKLNYCEKRAAVWAVQRAPKILYRTLMEQASLTYIYRNTIYKTLKEKGLIRHRYKKKPKLNTKYTALRLRFAKEYHNFNWRRYTVKFSNKCLVK